MARSVGTCVLEWREWFESGWLLGRLWNGTATLDKQYQRTCGERTGGKGTRRVPAQSTVIEELAQTLRGCQRKAIFPVSTVAVGVQPERRMSVLIAE